MQSLEEILEFKDKNADSEKVTYEWVNENFTHYEVCLILHASL